MFQQIKPSTLGIAALASISIDAILVIQDVKAQLADGFQVLPDIAAIAFKDFGKLQGFAGKFKPAWAEIKDLQPGELSELVDKVSADTGVPKGKVMTEIKFAFRTADRIYGWGAEGYDIFEDIRDEFAKKAA